MTKKKIRIGSLYQLSKETKVAYSTILHWKKQDLIPFLRQVGKSCIVDLDEAAEVVRQVSKLSKKREEYSLENIRKIVHSPKKFRYHSVTSTPTPGKGEMDGFTRIRKRPRKPLTTPQ